MLASLASLLTHALVLSAPLPLEAQIPTRPTPTASLSKPGLAHQTLLEIEQDFHPDDDYEIALDAWVAKKADPSLAGVRMWWMDTSKGDERSPFGKGVRKHIDIDYVQHGDDAWEIRIKQGRKHFVFEVELADDGTLATYGDVISDGKAIEHCRVVASRLLAKKFLGIPTGLRGLDVTCVDSCGDRHRGRLQAK